MAKAPKFEWRSCGLTTVGAVRKHNEDAYLTLPEQSLWVVADGMGGHAKGDVASQSIIDSLADFKPKRTLSTSIEHIEQRVLGVNEEMYSQSKGRPENVMGSTVALIYAYGEHLFYMWAGDSRIYRLRNGQLKQVSHDHSFVQEIVDKGMMSPEEASSHPQSNIVTRAVGVSDKLVLEIDHDIVEPGDKFLLCSDGLFKDISLKEITQIMGQIPFKAAQALIDKALANEANDNVTVIVVEAAAAEGGN
ncbi:MAG: PP2C family protein-serine/threonine phosphatase [Pseudomonadota bacterium]